MQRIFKILLFVGIIISGIAALAIYWTFYRPLPDYSDSVNIPQLNQPVQIKWDSYGVPHIYARNKHDLYMAMGYVHAQDRLWQMTVSQMAAQGRFAEFFGKDLVPIDKLQRTIGFWRIAKKMKQQLPDSTKNILAAYADGVNQYAKTHAHDLPVQFSLAGMNPIRWTPTHSLALTRLTAWELNTSWKTELTYSLLHEKLDSTAFAELFPKPFSSSNLPDSAADSDLSTAITPLLQSAQIYLQLRQTEGHSTGGNAWAIGGSRSKSGKPILAGASHRSLSIPGEWYEVHLNLNGRNLSGATLPGIPSVFLGQNDVLAWSFTNLMLDDTDFFEERLSPRDDNRYLIDSLAGKPVYKPFNLQHEIIKVKNGDDRPFTRKSTDHGPVISDIYPDQKQAGHKIISMKWTGQQPSEELQALQIMGWAQNLKTFQQGVKKFKNPAQNVIYADTAGNIGLFIAANIPIRKGNPILVRPGWSPEMDWQGTVNGKALPKIINPQKGWVASVNNAVADSNFSYYISAYRQPESRFSRIRQYLSGSEKLGPKNFQIMQNDTYSGDARAVTQLILPVLKNSTDSSFATAVKYLENWDYTYGKAETAASILDVFMLQLSQNTFRDEMGPELYMQFVNYSAQPSRVLLRLLKNGSPFFDDATTARVESKEAVIRQSMQQTLSFLGNNFGPEPANWQWQNLHTLTLNPALFSRALNDSSASSTLKLVVRNVLSKGPYPAAGNRMTINNGAYAWANPFSMVAGSSIRRIVDLSDLRQSRSIMPGGQSGNPLSRFYNDQTDSWLNGQYKYLMQDSTRFHQTKTMQLRPKK